MSWSEFLKYAASPGIAVIVGVVLSVVVEYIPSYELLEPKWKRAVFVILCFVVPLTATALAIATGVWGAWGDFQETWWPAITAAFAATASGTIMHTRKL